MHASFVGTLVGLIGLVIIISAWRDYDWLFRYPKAALLVKLYGRAHARKRYLFMGTALLGLGLMFCLGWVR